jgi:hypothetical protein
VLSTFWTQLGLAALFVALGFAWWKGGPAERMGATFNVSVGILVMVTDTILQPDIRPMVALALDAGLAIGFLALAVRYASLWLGGAMMLQAVQFSMHAFYLVSERAPDATHARINNIDSYGIVACIMVGTALTWRKRVKERASEPQERF